MMRTYHDNGEYWYYKDWTVSHRIRHWFIWLGGWEKPNGEGWWFRYPSGSWKRPYPVSLLGHRVTFQPWGWSVRTRHGYLCYSTEQGHRKFYTSPDGTPDSAHTWFFGAPSDVVQAADEWRQELDARMKASQ